MIDTYIIDILTITEASRVDGAVVNVHEVVTLMTSL
jgi:hypothetical protein